MELTKDIAAKIDELFLNQAENKEVKHLLAGLWSTRLTVGSPQLARSLLILSEGNVDIIRKIIGSHFNGDPRDVIMEAEYKLGNPGHYFIPTFDEIKLKAEKKRKK